MTTGAGQVMSEAGQLTARDRFNRLADGLTNALGSIPAVVLSVLVVVTWALSGPIFGFSDSWQLVINTSTTVVTFWMAPEPDAYNPQKKLFVTCSPSPPTTFSAFVIAVPAPVCVKLTIVPSGTGLPAQSRTGSVSTRTPFAVRCALIRRLQGSEATNCTTRVSVSRPALAVTCSGPAWWPEFVRTQAIPPLAAVESTVAWPPFSANRNSIALGASTRF